MSSYAAITDRIISLIETSGELPWNKPWNVLSPVNAISSKPYRGINRLVLSVAGFSDPRFLTYKQATDLGGHVRKGEKGLPVVFWLFESREEEDDTHPSKKYAAPLNRTYVVFNVEQCDGLDLPAIEARCEFNPIVVAEDIVRGYKDRPSITHLGDRACYIPSKDLVLLPVAESFDTTDTYYSVLFHELTHSTGAAKRLARNAVLDPIHFGSETYAQEELVAELGAAFLCADSGIENTVERSAAYVQNWLQVLRNDKSMIVRAACQAQRAADYVLGRVDEKIQRAA